ncbi:PIN domain protein [Treponema primitia ZAS-2]|uniref:PIN domain protein n=1 Tax=Treponema primitia (strain ATCC BAA-887 / DSM 12427 / ZAS-2) TaxID=545694 RepID=F5YJJ0_TREPZ|nr:PIN domain-containing protein [Treponema primitia]AEF84556.1 PIN domain protein [Treponema primitia ZAS-2]
MNVLVDTNVVLDVLLERSAFYADSLEVFKSSEIGKISGWVSASAMTDIFYIVRKDLKDIDDAYILVEDLTRIFSIALVSETAIINALALHWRDFEDAVQYATAKENGFDCIITRNPQDYENADIPVLLPSQLYDVVSQAPGAQH